MFTVFDYAPVCLQSDIFDESDNESERTICLRINVSLNQTAVLERVDLYISKSQCPGQQLNCLFVQIVMNEKS